MLLHQENATPFDARSTRVKPRCDESRLNAALTVNTVWLATLDPRYYQARLQRLDHQGKYTLNVEIGNAAPRPSFLIRPRMPKMITYPVEKTREAEIILFSRASVIIFLAALIGEVFLAALPFIR